MVVTASAPSAPVTQRLGFVVAGRFWRDGGKKSMWSAVVPLAGLLAEDDTARVDSELGEVDPKHVGVIVVVGL